MSQMLSKFLIQLFITLGDLLITKGAKAYQQWSDMKAAIAKGQKYDKIVNDPNSSLADRLKAEDELGN